MTKKEKTMTKNLNNECFEQTEIDELHEDTYGAKEIEAIDKEDDDKDYPCHVCNTESKEIHKEEDKVIVWCPVCGTLTTFISGHESNLVPEVIQENENVWDY